MRKLFFLLCVPFASICANIQLPENYDSVVESLIYFKDDHFKVFYGGPIDSSEGCNWVMGALFEDENNQIKSVYEIAFIRCSPDSENLKNAKLFLSTVSDIDLRFKNEDSAEYKYFMNILEASTFQQPSVIIREADIANMYYPKLFIAQGPIKERETYQDQVINFLKCKYKINSKLNKSPNELVGVYGEKRTFTRLLDGKRVEFAVSHYFLEDEPWKSYYLIHKKGVVAEAFFSGKNVTLRIDSGCTSGQLYGDNACDCLDQLDEALLAIAEEPTGCGIVIHIPTQDGRGFGFAPKAETEIYKKGGKGRVHATPPLDTIQAANLLYNSGDIDIRTYEGCAKIIRRLGIKNVTILTDNKKKLTALENEGIIVTRKTAFTGKQTCLSHLNAKKQSGYYFNE